MNRDRVRTVVYVQGHERRDVKRNKCEMLNRKTEWYNSVPFPKENLSEVPYCDIEFIWDCVVHTYASSIWKHASVRSYSNCRVLSSADKSGIFSTIISLSQYNDAAPYEGLHANQYIHPAGFKVCPVFVSPSSFFCLALNIVVVLHFKSSVMSLNIDQQLAPRRRPR